MLAAEIIIFALAGPSLRRAMQSALGAIAPLAAGRRRLRRLRPALAAGAADADAVEVFGVEFHRLKNTPSIVAGLEGAPLRYSMRPLRFAYKVLTGGENPV